MDGGGEEPLSPGTGGSGLAMVADRLAAEGLRSSNSNIWIRPRPRFKQRHPQEWHCQEQQKKKNDLKNYFTTLSVGSSSTSSHPSTHESGNTTTSVAGEVVQENEALETVATDLAHVDIGVDDAQPPEGPEPPEPQQQEDEDENIVEAMSLLVDVKARLMSLRNDGWEQLLEEVKSFCVAKEIPIPNMEEAIPSWGRSRRDGHLITQEHHYCVDTFLAALDSIIMEMDHRFNEVSSGLLVSFAYLDPRDNFVRFDVEKIARITEIYDQDFSIRRDNIREELETFLVHVSRVDDFKSCHELGSLATTMIAKNTHIIFPSVYRIIELALILPVATSSVERAFSAMHFIKTALRNKMGDEWLNNLLVCYIEKRIFKELGVDKVKKRFQSMKTRRVSLPKSPRRHRSSWSCTSSSCILGYFIICNLQCMDQSHRIKNYLFFKIEENPYQALDYPL